MSYFTINDIFDNIVQLVQVIPMESYYFKRQKIKIDLNIKKYTKKLEKIKLNLPRINKKRSNSENSEKNGEKNAEKRSNSEKNGEKRSNCEKNGEKRSNSEKNAESEKNGESDLLKDDEVSRKTEIIENKLMRLYKIKSELLQNFKECINKNISSFNKLCEISNKNINPKHLNNTGLSNLTIKLSQNSLKLKLNEKLNEKYCICNENMSYGSSNMICCDNPKCKINWFHFKCVGLTTSTTPKEGWLCFSCKGNK